MADLYLFVSTRSAASLPTAYNALNRMLGPNILALNIGNRGQYWNNGCVIRMRSRDPVHKWKDFLQTSLNGIVEFWLLHDGAGRAIDNMNEGPGAMALTKLGSKSVNQLFLRYDKHDVRQVGKIELLKTTLEKGKVSCRYAFDFSNGAIYWLTSTQPSNPIYRRCENALRQPIEFVFTMQNGICYAPDQGGELYDDNAWTTLLQPNVSSIFAA